MLNSRICLALDYPHLNDCVILAHNLISHDQVGMLKIGLEMFSNEGPDVIDRVKGLFREVPIFLDLKLHDIPNTVEQAAHGLAQRGVKYLTVHASGGPEMVKAAVRGAGNWSHILGVTVLTSMDNNMLGEMGISASVSFLAGMLGGMATHCGAKGLICSPHEVRTFRQALGPAPVLVVPGIRPESDKKNDQVRVSTPYDAVQNGATYIVIGRPITKAKDPIAAAQAINKSIESFGPPRPS